MPSPYYGLCDLCAKIFVNAKITEFDAETAKNATLLDLLEHAPLVSSLRHPRTLKRPPFRAASKSQTHLTLKYEAIKQSDLLLTTALSAGGYKSNALSLVPE